jgi:hypothetical protein
MTINNGLPVYQCGADEIRVWQDTDYDWFVSYYLNGEGHSVGCESLQGAIGLFNTLLFKHIHA